MEDKEIKVSLNKKTYDKLEQYAQSIGKLVCTSHEKEEYFDTKEMRVTNLNRGFLIRFIDEKPIETEFRSLFYNNSSSMQKWFTEKITTSLPITSEGAIMLNTMFHRLMLPPLREQFEPMNYFDFKDALKENGLIPRLHITRSTTEYRNDTLSFSFDNIEELGCFVQIKVLKEGNINEVVKNIPMLKGEKIVSSSYNDIMTKNIKSCLTNEQKKFLFTINPSWNMLLHEVEVVHKLFQDKQENYAVL